VIIFSNTRYDELRQRRGQVCGTLVLRSADIESPRHGKKKVRCYYREFRHLDGDGNRLPGKLIDKVMAGDEPAKLTVLLVERVNVLGEVGCAQKWPSGGRHLEPADAKLCGYRSLDALKDDWKQRHPMSELAKLVYFALGDFRDPDRYISRGFADYMYAYDPVHVIDELPALSKEQLAELATHNHQRHTARQAHSESLLTQIPLHERVAQLEAAGDRIIANNLKIIRERIRRAQRKLA